MLLEEIKKNCKIITNEEHQGEELYFDEKPTNKGVGAIMESSFLYI